MKMYAEMNYKELEKLVNDTQDNLKKIQEWILTYRQDEEMIGEKTGQKGVIDFLQNNFSLNEIELPEEYGYSCLPLCLLDAIYSIGVRYTSTQNVVKNYCENYNIIRLREDDKFLEQDKEHTITDLIKNIEEVGCKEFADNKVCNKQLTSSKNGILKSEAVYKCAKILQEHEIETIKDFNEKVGETVEREYKAVQGQGSGISFSYLKMLCGDADTIKPDRHIIRFLSKFFEIQEKKQVEQAQHIMESIVREMKKTYKDINLRKLDYLIWKEMSAN